MVDVTALFIQHGQYIAIINGIILLMCEFCNNGMKFCKFSDV